MKLGQKNLVYSMVLAGIMLVFLTGYFSYMLPSLYVDYCMEQNLKSIRRQHAAYMDTGTYDGIQVKNSTACYSVDIPLEGGSLRVTGKAFSVEVELQEERLLRILQETREILKEYWAGNVQPEKGESLEEMAGTEVFGQIQEELSEVFRELYGEMKEPPFQIHVRYSGDMGEAYFNESVKFHIYSDSMVVIEAGIEDSENKYTNYIAAQMTQDRIVLSFLPVMTPDIEEIRPIVWQSFPMLGAVVILVVLLGSRMYSRGIVTPIVQLSNHAEQMKYVQDFSVKRLDGKWKEKQGEIQELADILDDFYARIREGYRQLQEKNAQLEAENEREEVFLRTSAHQLKTPVAAALLLTDGMIHGVGKYKDVETYLPKVKEQLLSMRKMTEDILYLNRCVKEIQLQMICTRELLREKLKLLEPVLVKRRLQVEYEDGMEAAEGARMPGSEEAADGTGVPGSEETADGKEPEEAAITGGVLWKGEDGGKVCTDERMFSQIIDSLLSNAVTYTPEGEQIRVWVSRDGRKIRIENMGARIPETLLPRIFEPFAGGEQEHSAGGTRGHGLGLYIASYFAKKLGITVSVTNGKGRAWEADGKDSVVAMVTFGDAGDVTQGGMNLHETFMGTSSEIHMDTL